MLKNDDDLEFNQNYWAFIKILLDEPDKFLNFNGKILLKIVEGSNKHIINQKYIARELNVNQCNLSVKCKKLENQKYICRTKKKLSKILMFHPRIIEKGKEVPLTIIKNRK